MYCWFCICIILFDLRNEGAFWPQHASWSESEKLFGEGKDVSAFATHLPIWAWSGWLFCSFRWPARWNLFPAAECPCNTTSHTIHSAHATNDLATESSAFYHYAPLSLLRFYIPREQTKKAAITLNSNRTRWPSNFEDYSEEGYLWRQHVQITTAFILFMGLLNRQIFIETVEDIKDSFFARATQHVRCSNKLLPLRNT